MPKKATVLKDISGIIKKGAILERKGQYYVLEGKEKGDIPNKGIGGEDFITPNYYHKDIVKGNKRYFKLTND